MPRSATQSPVLKVHMRSGELYTLVNWHAAPDGSRVEGTGRRDSIARVAQETRPVSIATSDVTLFGGLVTGGALTAACTKETSGCAGVGLITLGLWLAIGAACAPSLESSSRLQLRRPSFEQLQPFARLPQGLPAGVTRATLGPAAGTAPVDAKP